jgi:uracil-DNA glycosylase
MQVQIEEGWKQVLEAEFTKPYFEQLIHFVKSEYAEHTCFPKGKDIFAAFEYCRWEDVKVVIIGQDPYHGPGQANGLCFSVHDQVQHPPSLINIFKELETDLGKPYPVNGDLSTWAKQGVLLLNATLTVRAHTAGSHQNKGWETFTDAVIQQISFHKKQVVFLLWGNYAKQKGKLIDRSKHQILETGHPSPLSANRGLWFGNKHFSKTNEILKQVGKKEIEW